MENEKLIHNTSKEIISNVKELDGLLLIQSNEITRLRTVIKEGIVKSKGIILTIEDKGDSSVGIQPQYWDIEVPVIISDTNNHTKDEKEELELFKVVQINIYQEYSEGKIVAYYNFEIQD